jgi:hypothetical protein
MPMTGQGLKYVMTAMELILRNATALKSEAKACEGNGGQAIEEGGGGNWGHIIRGIEILVIMKAGAIPKNQALWSQEL